MARAARDEAIRKKSIWLKNPPGNATDSWKLIILLFVLRGFSQPKGTEFNAP